jgi:hypothetical protein
MPLDVDDRSRWDPYHSMSLKAADLHTGLATRDHRQNRRRRVLTVTAAPPVHSHSALGIYCAM